MKSFLPDLICLTAKSHNKQTLMKGLCSADQKLDQEPPLSYLLLNFQSYLDLLISEIS